MHLPRRHQLQLPRWPTKRIAESIVTEGLAYSLRYKVMIWGRASHQELAIRAILGVTANSAPRSKKRKLGKAEPPQSLSGRTGGTSRLRLAGARGTPGGPAHQGRVPRTPERPGPCFCVCKWAAMRLPCWVGRGRDFLSPSRSWLMKGQPSLRDRRGHRAHVAVVAGLSVWVLLPSGLGLGLCHSLVTC